MSTPSTDIGPNLLGEHAPCRAGNHHPNTSHAHFTLSSRARVTVYSRLMLWVCQVGRTPEANRPWWTGIIAITAAPSVVFIMWMISTPTERAPRPLWAAMWLAGTWVILGPLLTVVWERQFLSLSCSLDCAPIDEGWNLTHIARATRSCDLVAVPAGLAAMGLTVFGFLMNLGFFRHTVELGPLLSWSFIAGLLSVAYLGYSFGTGIWGAAKSLIVARSALTSHIRWFPFRPRQVEALEEFGKFSYITGLVFSMGFVFLPGLYLIAGKLNIAAWIAGGLLTLALVALSLLCFLYPTYLIQRVASHQKAAVLADFAPPIEAIAQALIAEDNDSRGLISSFALQSRLRSLLDLRQSVLSEVSAPAPQWLVARTGSLILLPIAVSVMSSAVHLRL